MERYYKKRDEILAKQAIFRQENNATIKERAKKARKKYNHSEYANKKNKEYRENITNAYIRQRLIAIGTSKDQITKELIEKKHAQILIERIKKCIEKTGAIKICGVCKKMLPLSSFGIRQWEWKGEKKYKSDCVCKECSNTRNKKYKNEGHSKPEKPSV